MFPDLTISPIIPNLAKQLGLTFPGLAMDAKMADHSEKKLDNNLSTSLNSSFNNSLSLIPLTDGSPTPLKLTKEKDFVGNPEKYYSVEDFIELVKDTPYLFDKYHRLYRDSHIKDARWSEIGSRYGMTGPQMVKKWTHIRDRYKRILNEVMVRQARGEHFQPSWKFFDVLHGMLCKNYSAANITVQSSPKPQAPVSPGSNSPVTTIAFANAAQLYTAAMHQVAMSQSLNSNLINEPGSDKDEIIAADFMVAETHIEDDAEEDNHEQDVDRDDAASTSSGADAQSHHSLNSHKENTAPGQGGQKRPIEMPNEIAAPAPPAKKRKNSTSDQDSGCEKDNEKDFIDHFINYIGERIRTHDKVQQFYVVNKIHQALFDFEMELAKP